MVEAARGRTQSPAEIRRRVRERALGLGFDAIGFADPGCSADAGEKLAEFIARGWHGDMGWLADSLPRRRHPRALWPMVKSLIVVGLNYGPETSPLETLDQRDVGTVSVYARNRDYHDIIKGRLKQLGGWLHRHTGGEVKIFVDTAPVLEKPLAQAAGLGWQGKHTNLVSRSWGSWLFLGTIFTSLELAADDPETDHCGSCQACLDVCPTGAFPAPYQLDARRCISYLTIEHKGHIHRDLRPLLGNRIYGCDDCIAVCPWNKYARPTNDAKLQPRSDLAAPLLAELAALDDLSFRKRFAGSPIKRIGRDRFVRNVLIAIGNSGNRTLAESARKRLTDRSPLVRATAVWALSQLLLATEFSDLRSTFVVVETDPAVLAEWQAPTR